MDLFGRYHRWLYRGKRPSKFAQLQNRISATAFSAGIWPKHAATLEVRGRRTGRTISFPVAIADLDGERYLASMLGEGVNWVRNVRAADGRATLRHGRTESVRLEDVPAAQRGRIIQRYVDVAPGARPHIPVGRHAPLAEFERIAPGIPVFRIVEDEPAAARPQ